MTTNNLLFEGLGKLAAVGDWGIMKLNSLQRKNIGENINIKITKDLHKAYSYCYSSIKVLGVFVRYERDAIAFIVKKSYDDKCSFDIKTSIDNFIYNSTEHLDDVSGRWSTYSFSTTGALSGFQKNMKYLIKWLAIALHEDPKVTTSKIDYQIVYADENREEVSRQRMNATMPYGFYKMNDGHNRTNIVRDTRSYVWSNNLKRRLEKYINNKLPDLSILKKLNNWRDCVENIKKFKIGVAIYELSESTWSNSINIVHFLSGSEQPKLIYRFSNLSNLSGSKSVYSEFPISINIILGIDIDKIVVKQVYGEDIYGKDLPLENFKFMVNKQVNESVILKEGIEEIKRYFPKLDEETLKKAISLDPTYKGGDELGKYGKWILKLVYNNLKNIEKKKQWDDLMAMYPDGINPKTNTPFVKPEMLPAVIEEDLYKIPELLTKYEQYKKFISTDISKMPDLPTLWRNIQSVEQNIMAQLSSDDKNIPATIKAFKNAMECGLEIVYEDKEWIVGVPTTYESSVCFGHLTNWCTTSRDSSESYNRYLNGRPEWIGSKYFINLHKPSDELYQWHFESNQFMDASDQPVNIVDIIGDDTKLKEFYLNYMLIQSNNKNRLVKMILENEEWVKGIKLTPEMKTIILSACNTFIDRYDDYDLTQIPSTVYEMGSTNKELALKIAKIVDSAKKRDNRNDVFSDCILNTGFIHFIQKVPELYEEYWNYISTNLRFILTQYNTYPAMYENLQNNETVFKQAKIEILGLLIEGKIKVETFLIKEFYEICMSDKRLKDEYYSKFVGTENSSPIARLFSNSEREYNGQVIKKACEFIKQDDKLMSIINDAIKDGKIFEYNNINTKTATELGGLDFVYNAIMNPNTKASSFDNLDIISNKKLFNKLLKESEKDIDVLTRVSTILVGDNYTRIGNDGSSIIVSGIEVSEYCSSSNRNELSGNTIEKILFDSSSYMWDLFDDNNYIDSAYEFNNVVTGISKDTIEKLDKQLIGKTNYKVKDLFDYVYENFDGDDDIIWGVKRWVRESYRYGVVYGAENEAHEDIVYGIKDYFHCTDIEIDNTNKRTDTITLTYKPDTFHTIISHIQENVPDILEYNHELTFRIAIVCYNDDNSLSISEPYYGWNDFDDYSFEQTLIDTFQDDYVLPQTLPTNNDEELDEGLIRGRRKKGINNSDDEFDIVKYFIHK
jgi:hypothetical protein